MNISSSQIFNKWSQIYLNRLEILKSLEISLNINSWFNIKFKFIKDIKTEFKRVKNLKSLKE